MKILLIGEYSNVHWTLAEGLRSLGHRVCVVSNGDFWKNYKRDISLVRHEGKIGGIRYLLETYATLPFLRGYDVVQIINPMFLEVKAERIQLHMFGLYLTIQDKNFKHSATNNIDGMITASVVSSSKAYNGEISKYEHLTLASDMLVSDTGLSELQLLSTKLNKPELLTTGLCCYDDFIITAIPTILVDKPKTLVGMGDTISSISLLAGA